MSNYDNWKLATPDDEQRECNQCGIRTTEIGDCDMCDDCCQDWCAASHDRDDDATCPDCGEPDDHVAPLPEEEGRCRECCRTCIAAGRADDDEPQVELEDDEDDTLYCANCDNEAVCRTSVGTPLCFTCKCAYEWGQASPDATFTDIEG